MTPPPDSWQWRLARRIDAETATQADIERWLAWEGRASPGPFYEGLIRLLLKRLTEVVAWSAIWKRKARQLEKQLKQLGE